MAAALAGRAVAAVTGGGDSQEWTTKTFQVNGVNTNDLLFGCCCFPCAGAAAQSTLNSSNICFNFLCVPPPAVFNTVRLSYNIRGECGEDMLYGMFCTPCVVRQAYTETETRGALSGGKYGALSDDWHFSLTGCECLEFFTALLCPCYVANTIRKVLHPTSDSWFNYLCIVPCSMYGIVRHTYGLKTEFPHETCEDLAVGTVCYPCALTRAVKEAPYQRTTGKVNNAIETAHKKAEEMKSTLQNAKASAMSKVPGMGGGGGGAAGAGTK